MPHNLYLHSSLVLSRKISRDKPHRVHDAIWYSRLESAGALFVTFVVNLALVATNATHFYNKKCAELGDAGAPYACLADAVYVDSGDAAHGSGGAPCYTPASNGTVADGRCGPIGLQSEGAGLSSTLGSSSKYIWAVGLLAAGQASTMTCTYAGQVCDASVMTWRDDHARV